jgi:hypothetical protein
MKYLPRPIAEAKLAAMVAGARMMRNELELGRTPDLSR